MITLPLTLIGAWMLGGAVLAPAAAAEAPPATTPSTLFVARRAWHIDIGFAAADLHAPLDSVAAQFPGVKYLFFGFGDRHYLLAKKQGAAAMLGALWPGPGMLLVTALKTVPAEAFGAPGVIELTLSPAEAAAAQTFIGNSFAAVDPAGPNRPVSHRPVSPYAPGPYEGSLYFSAVPRYSALYTCNTWAAEALKAAGLPVRTRAVLFAGQVWTQASRRARVQAPSTSDIRPARAQAPRSSGAQSQGGGPPF